MQISKTQISATEWHLEIKDPAGFVVFDGPLFLGTRTVDIEIDDLVARLTNPQPWTPTEAEQLPGAQAVKLRELFQAYQAEVSQPISYLGYLFDADDAARTNIKDVLTSYEPAGALPADFYWVTADNQRAPMTLAELQGLPKAMADRGWAAFKKLQDLKSQVRAVQPTDPDPIGAVQAIAW
ncbi:MAG: DUF4376 domain-containing protein [Pseudomonadota bacterium]